MLKGSPGTGGGTGAQGADGAQGSQGFQGVIGTVFAAGTRMLFQQTSAPTGWTKDTGLNNRALEIVTGTVGSGGGNAFTSALTLQSLLVMVQSLTIRLQKSNTDHTITLHFRQVIMVS